SGKPIELAAIGATLSDRARPDLVERAAECWDEFGAADALDVGHYIERLREYEHQRRLARELERSRAALFDAELDYHERIEVVSQALPAALEQRGTSTLGTAEALADEVEEVARRNADARERGVSGDMISTGIPDLDQAMGGFAPGRLDIFAARSGYGKTTVLCDFALNAAEDGRSVGYIALEQPRLEIFLSLLQKQTGLLPAEVREGLIEPQQLTDAIAPLKTLPITIESGGFNLRGLTMLIRRLHLVRKVELVIVDYLQLVANRLHGQSRATEVAGISAELKRLAIELNISIIGAAQLNKGPEARKSGRPQIRDIRESEALAYDADQVIFLVRPDLRGGQSGPYLELAKNRHGPMVREIPLVFDKRRNRYEPRVLQAVG
ncbi:MAG: DnaB-like helicase C-terminal domain-containing protein, partial [Myxococcales bacterium]|nr:DnaB-like helicase C-terminal domain-containing protein [Myxococcales bacterium]